MMHGWMWNVDYICWEEEKLKQLFNQPSRSTLGEFYIIQKLSWFFFLKANHCIQFLFIISSNSLWIVTIYLLYIKWHAGEIVVLYVHG